MYRCGRRRVLADRPRLRIPGLICAHAGLAHRARPGERVERVGAGQAPSARRSPAVMRTPHAAATSRTKARGHRQGVVTLREIRRAGCTAERRRARAPRALRRHRSPSAAVPRAQAAAGALAYLPDIDLAHRDRWPPPPLAVVTWVLRRRRPPSSSRCPPRGARLDHVVVTPARRARPAYLESRRCRGGQLALARLLSRRSRPPGITPRRISWSPRAAPGVRVGVRGTRRCSISEEETAASAVIFPAEVPRGRTPSIPHRCRRTGAAAVPGCRPRVAQEGRRSRDDERAIEALVERDRGGTVPLTSGSHQGSATHPIDRADHGGLAHGAAMRGPSPAIEPVPLPSGRRWLVRRIRRGELRRVTAPLQTETVEAALERACAVLLAARRILLTSHRRRRRRRHGLDGRARLAPPRRGARPP